MPGPTIQFGNADPHLILVFQKTTSRLETSLKCRAATISTFAKNRFLASGYDTMLSFFQIIQTKNFSNQVLIAFLTSIWKGDMCWCGDFGSFGRSRENSERVFEARAMCELSRKIKTCMQRVVQTTNQTWFCFQIPRKKVRITFFSHSVIRTFSKKWRATGLWPVGYDTTLFFFQISHEENFSN